MCVRKYLAVPADDQQHKIYSLNPFPYVSELQRSKYEKSLSVIPKNPNSEGLWCEETREINI